MFFDPYYIIVLPAVILAFWAQHKVRKSFQLMSEVRNMAGLTGAQVARRILDANGLHDVEIVPEPGHLTDHYDPRTRTVHLSEVVYGQRSLAALGVAAHECGHAIQHSTAYSFLQFRHALLGPAQFGSNLAIPLFFIGLIFSSLHFLTTIGIIFFSFAVLFHIVTLPVEYDASRRAMAILGNGGYLSPDEVDGAKKVLDAAAWTYVAGALMAVLQLIHLLILRERSD
ncbi:MAG: zinc metallopeptidase [bacterium]|nr:zinc metallopeptidase [bacterium]